MTVKRGEEFMQGFARFMKCPFCGYMNEKDSIVKRCMGCRAKRNGKTLFDNEKKQKNRV